MRVQVSREALMGSGVMGELFLGDSLELSDRLTGKYGGRVQCVYLDPPFFTGSLFNMRVRVGEREWRSGAGSLELSAYADKWASAEEYISEIRALAELARELMSDTGVIFLHVDWRMQARLRIMMDEVFGENNFMNEIIWTYQTGGRARKYFSRKHDVILFYRKGPAYRFYIENVPISRTDARRNHMKRQVDKDGRVYRTIKSGGKVYKYYDDDPVYPGDVWDDVSHLQQKDPQRTGYDTQKPLKLLERVVLCSTRPGDIVCDLTCGSGTALEAAAINGRNFVGVDMSPLAVQTARRRLVGSRVSLNMPGSEGSPEVELDVMTGVGNYECDLRRFSPEPGVGERAFDGLDAVTGWSGGYINDDVFYSYVHDMRSKQHPRLDAHLSIPVWDGVPAVRIEDVYGRAFYYTLDL
ncbi:MAG: DNA methyltransferase [Candidatus Fimadaptatus sp.]